MKIIRYMYNTITEVHCSCCMEDHTARFDICKDYDGKTIFTDSALYIVIREHNKNPIKDRLKRSLYFIKNWKKYINGDDIASNGILMKVEQTKALYDTLVPALLDAKILTKDDLDIIEKDGKDYTPDRLIPITYKNKKQTEDMNVSLIGDEFVISLDTFESDDKTYFRDLTFGYRLYKEYTFKDVIQMTFYHFLYGSNNFVGGDFESFMNKDEVLKMLKVFYYLNNTILET